MTRNLRRATTFTSAVLLLRVMTQAAALSLAARFLGPMLYGQAASASALATVLGIIPNLGAGLVVIAISGRSSVKASHVWRYVWPQHLVLAPVIGCIYLAGTHFVIGNAVSIGILATFAVSEILVTPITLQISATLQAIDRVPLSQFLQWAGLFLRICALSACFFLPVDPLTGYASSQLIASLCGFFLTFYVASHYVDLKGKPRLATRTELRDGVVYCGTSVVASASVEIDKVIALRSASAYDAGLYATLSRIVSAGTLPIIGMMLSAQPRLFEQARSSPEATRKLVIRIGLISVIFGLSGAIALNFAGPLLIGLFGSKYSGIDQVIPIISLAIPAMSMRLSGTSILLTLGRPMRRIVIDTIGVVFLSLFISLGGRELGLVGLAGGLVAGETLLAALAWGWVLVELRRLPR